jgi:hypothetical protein
MLRCKDLVCKNVEIDGKKVAKKADFVKTYFQYASNAEVEERDKQFNGAPIGRVTVPKTDAPDAKKEPKVIDQLFKEMLAFFQGKFENGTPEQGKMAILEIVTSGYDIQERAPVANSLVPVDEDKAIEGMAKSWLQMGGYPDPASGQKITELSAIIAAIRSFATGTTAK